MYDADTLQQNPSWSAVQNGACHVDHLLTHGSRSSPPGRLRLGPSQS